MTTLYILPLFYLRDEKLRALTCVAKNASGEIDLNSNTEEIAHAATLNVPVWLFLFV